MFGGLGVCAGDLEAGAGDDGAGDNGTTSVFAREGTGRLAAAAVGVAGAVPTVFRKPGYGSVYAIHWARVRLIVPFAKPA